MPVESMRSVILPSARQMPVFGLGSWRMGEHADRFQHEVGVIRAAMDLGVSLIDTAEMYGEGGAELVIGEALRGRRDEVFVVSKFYPHNASHAGVIEACERSLRRLACDSIDLYLLHWPGSIPLAETFAALNELKHQGKIGDFGVSNFDLRNLQDISAADQSMLACNQVFYNLAHREVEWQVVDWCRQRSIPIMAYSPLDQASSMLKVATLAEVAARHDASSAQIALAWLLHQPNTVVIPKSVRLERLRENLAALEIELSPRDLADLEARFPAPTSPVRLGMR